MACKPKREAFICAFVLEMKGYFDRLESLNMVFDAELSINIIISCLPVDYNQFVQTTEQGIKKINVPSTSAALVLTVGHNAKKRKTSHSNWKGKAKKESPVVSLREAKSETAPTSYPKEAVCFYCNTKGHWKHSCPKYLKDRKDEKVEKGSHSCMFMIELHNTTTSDSWVLDTGCGAHIYTVLQGLKESRRLKHRELNLVIGNKKITPVTRIGKYEIMLKYGVRIDLYNCFYSLEMTRNIILFHALSKDGYKFLFDNENGDILVYSNGCFIFKVSPCKGIYEIVKCISHNDNVILNVGSSNEHDKSKLWHSSLGHVNKKRIAQLQKDRVLESFDFKLDDVYESCLLAKMTKLPFIGSCERDMDGKVHSYKSRLVVKGYTQTYMIDYKEAFSPAAKIKLIRIMLVIAVFHDYKIWHMDVKCKLLAVAFFFRQWEVPSGSGNFLTSSGNALCILFPTILP
nr:hypothetical protein [Tanacetum cinerariifolium]